MDELIKKINECGVSISELEELRYLKPRQLMELGESLDNDQYRLELLQYIAYPLAIIRTMKTESIILKALKNTRLKDNDKLKTIVQYLKSDEAIKSAIDELDSDKNKYLASLKLSRTEAQKYFLVNNRTYSSFDLDEKITIGMEIEAESLDPSLGDINSNEIIEIVSNYRSG